jgi:hypothetical protein
VQEVSPLGVVLGSQQVGKGGFEADHELVAFGQCTDSDERLAQMREGLTVG